MSYQQLGRAEKRLSTVDEKKHRELAMKATDGMPLSDNQTHKLGLTNLILGIVCLIAGIVAFIVVGTTDSAELKLSIATDYRTEATQEATDVYPGVSEELGRLINVGFVAAAVSVAAGLSQVMAYLLNSYQAEQMAAGANWVVWISFMPWHLITFLIVAPLCGVTNVFLLAAFSLIVLAWLFQLYSADMLNSFAYLHCQTKAGLTGWSWIFTIFVLVEAVSLYVFLGIYAFETFNGATGFLAGLKTGWFIAVIIAHLVLYLGNPLIFVAWKMGWIGSMYTREMTYYIYNGIFAILSTALTLTAIIVSKP